MYFIGETRFSVYEPGSGAWSLARISEDEYFNRLFSDERLTCRFDIFFNKAVPIYAKMADNRFYRHIVTYSTFMPEKWRIRLKQEAAKYDFLILVELGKDNWYIPIAEILDGQPSGVLAWFRVDDDDLLPVNYLASLEAYTKEAFQGMLVSFGSGLNAIYDKHTFKNFRVRHFPFLGLGQAFIGGYNADEKSYWLPQSGKHGLVDLYTPTIVDSRQPMFVWTQHRFQDTLVHGHANLLNSAIRGMLADFKKIQGDDIDSLCALFPTIEKELRRDVLVGDENVLSVQNVVLARDKDSEEFCAEARPRSAEFLVDYSVFIEKNPSGSGDVTEDGVVICFDFEEKQDAVENLSLSGDRNVFGWYTYIPTRNGLSAGKIAFSLNSASIITRVKIIKWGMKKVELKIESLRISTQE